MHARNVRRTLRDPVWFLVLAALIVGALVGTALALEPFGDPTRAVLGRSWRADAAETRGFLSGVLGFEITLVTLVMSVNAMVIKSGAYQYSPRLIPLYVQRAPLRRSLPWFVLLAAFLLAATRELGLVPDLGERPRFVVSAAVLLLLVVLGFAVADLVRTFRFVRVEHVLGLARDATYDAATRVRARVERLPLDASKKLDLPLDASALVARESGYLVDVDVGRLAELARRASVRARINHAIGDYVDEGEVIGWVASERGGAVSTARSIELTSTLAISAVREIDFDPSLGVRVVVDIANRSLSSSANDPYTARQALNQLRSVLRHVGRLPLGDWNVVDPDGSVRVSVMGTRLRDLLSLAVGGPLYYGGDHPDVLEGLLEIVHEVGWIARDPEDRAAARVCLERVDALAEKGEIDPERLARLRAEAEPVRRALREGVTPRAQG
jgi:uncharacterized membrane protein